MVADLLVPVQTNNPISRHTRSATLTRKRGCSTLGLLPPGPHPFRWFGLRIYPFGYFQSCNHPPRRDFISAHQAGITYLEIYPTVTDLCIQPVSEQGTASTLILPTTIFSLKLLLYLHQVLFSFNFKTILHTEHVVPVHSLPHFAHIPFCF